MSSAAAIVLTDADFDDLSKGHTINAMDDAGNEHNLGPNNLDSADIRALGEGLRVFVGDHAVEYHD